MCNGDDVFDRVKITAGCNSKGTRLIGFSGTRCTSEGFLSAIEAMNITIDKIMAIINKHNEKCKDFETIIKSAKEALELHFASEQIEQFNYYKRKENLDNCLRHIEQLKNHTRDI